MDRDGQPSQPEAWFVRIARAVPIVAGAILLIHVIILGTQHGTVKFLGSDIMQFAASALATAACIVPIMRYREFTRRSWSLLCSVFALWTLAQVIYTLNEYNHGPTFSDFTATDLIFFFSFMPFAFLVLMTEDDDDKMVNWQRVMDVLQVCLVAFCTYLYVFYDPARSLLAGHDMNSDIERIFAVRNMVLAAALWIRAVLTRSARERALFIYAGFFVSLYAASTRATNYMRLNYKMLSGNWIDIGWTLPFLIAAVMAVYWNEPVVKTKRAELSAGIRGLLAVHSTPALMPILVLLIASLIAAKQENIAMASTIILASFILYSVRLALTQYSQQQAVEVMRQVEGRFHKLFSNNPLPMWLWDRDTMMFLEVNDAAVVKYGFTREEFLGSKISIIQRPEILPALEQMLQHEETEFKSCEWQHVDKEGKLIDVLLTVESLEFSGHRAELVIAQDVSEQKQLEDQLRQAQKMEAIGNLAGGIAHDFNNLLTVICGYSQVVLERSHDDELLTHEIQQVELAAHRATALTRQLLAFSRRQVLQPQLLNLDTVVSGVERMLRRLIGEHIELTTECDPEAGVVKADPGQIEQVLINLAVNARDAMQNGGKLVFKVQPAEIDDAFAREHMGMMPGQYVLLSVKDTGTGMDVRTRAHILNLSSPQRKVWVRG